MIVFLTLRLSTFGHVQIPINQEFQLNSPTASTYVQVISAGNQKIRMATAQKSLKKMNFAK